MRLLLLIGLLAFIACVQGDTLSSSSVCASVLGYQQIYLTNPQSVLEASIASAPNIWSVLSPPCLAKVSVLMCSSVYVAFSAPVPPCSSQCQTVNSVCSSQELDILNAFGVNLNCTLLPTTNCYDGASSPSPVVKYPKCEAYTGSVCRGTIRYPIYVPWQYTQAQLEAKLSANQFLLQVASGACRQTLAMYLCSQVFPRCDTEVLSRAVAEPVPMPFPRLPCRSLCHEFEATCGNFITQFPDLRPNCSSVGEHLTGMEDFPANGTTFGSVMGQPLSTSCNNWNSTERASINVNTDSLSVGCEPLNTGLSNNNTSSNKMNLPSVCLSIVDYPDAVFIPPGKTQAQIEAVISQFPTLLTLLSPNCAKETALFFCYKAFMRCATPRLPCRAMCDNIQYRCNPVELSTISLFAGDLLSLDCNTLDSVNCNLPSLLHTPVIKMPRCEQYSGQVCKGVISYKVYIPWNYANQSALEATIAPYHFLYALAPRAAGTCNIALAEYICSQAFARCDDAVLRRAIGLDTPAPFPQFPCKSICTDFQQQCAPFIAQFPQLTPNCSTIATRVPDGFEDWPNDTIVFQNDTSGPFPVILTTQCNAWSAAEAALIRPNVLCPDPLVRANDINAPTAGGGQCSVPCPSVLWTRDEWRGASDFVFYMGILSLVLTSFTLLTWITFPAKRQQHYILSFNICTFGVALFFLIPSLGTEDQGVGRISSVTCKSNAEQHKQGDGGWCFVQSIFLYYFAIAAVCWWMIQSIDIYLKIVKGRVKETSVERVRKDRIYHIYAWCFPAIGLLITVSLEGFSGSQTTPWCFITNDDLPWLEWLVFYYPVAIMCVVGVACLGTVMVRLTKTIKAVGTDNKPGWWRMHIRPLLFIWQFLLIFLFIIIYRSANWVKQDEFRGAIRDFLYCLLSGKSNQECGGGPRIRPDYRLWYCIMFAVGGQGIPHFIVYGTMSDNYRMWSYVFHCKGIPQGQVLDSPKDESIQGAESSAATVHDSQAANENGGVQLGNKNTLKKQKKPPAEEEGLSFGPSI